MLGGTRVVTSLTPRSRLLVSGPVLPKFTRVAVSVEGENGGCTGSATPRTRRRGHRGSTPPTGFSGRWDDPDGLWRTLHVGGSRLACYLEVPAAFRPDLVLSAELDNIDPPTHLDRSSLGSIDAPWCGAGLWRWVLPSQGVESRLAGCWVVSRRAESSWAGVRLVPRHYEATWSLISGRRSVAGREPGNRCSQWPSAP